MAHQILHFHGLVVGFVFNAGVDDAELSFFLEGVVAIVEDKEDTAQHPNVNSVIDWVFEIEVDHLGRTVHQSGVLLEPFLIVVHL